MRNCIVLGSARSGTSMVAGILAKSGYHTGDNYLAPRDSNPTGFYEDQAVNRLNDRVLRTVVKEPPGWGVATRIPVARMALRPLLQWAFPRHTVDPALWLARPRETPSMPQSDAAIARELVAMQPFAYKDPRFCHTLPAWLPFLPDGTVRIVVFREPARTVNSIMREMQSERYRRVRFKRADALAVWVAAYRRTLEMRHDGGRWLFLHYDDIVQGIGLRALSDALHAPLDASHIVPSLRRSEAMGPISEAAAAVYRELSAAT